MTPRSLRDHEATYDVAVVGGGPGGLAAAIAAGRSGARTVLVERSSNLGGAASSGLGILGYLDRNGNTALGGIPQEIIDRLTQKGGALGHFRCPVHNSITPVSPDLVKIVAVEMCQEAGVDVLFNNELLDVSVNSDNRIESITTYGKLTRTTITASTFVDGTGDGDLAYLAGVPFVLGQDDTHIKQPATLVFTVTGFDLDRLFEYLNEHPDQVGIKEDYVTGYDVEFFKNTPGHCFIGLQQLISEARDNGEFSIPRNQFIYICTASPDLLAINTSRVIKIDASDPIELSNGLLTGYNQVWELVEFMRKYVPGFEKCEISQISPSLGIRETRHFEGLQRLTKEVIGNNIDDHAIALSAYNIDIHSGTSDYIDLTVVDKPFGIPYECMVPKELDGLLLSGRTISADTTTYASVRVMGPCLAMGEAAGYASALAVKGGTPVRDVDVDALQALLRENGAILDAVKQNAQ